MIRKIGVFGASGQTGRPLLKSLRKLGVEPRAIVRSMTPDGGMTDFRIAHLENNDEVLHALEGLDVVHFIPPLFDDREERFLDTILRGAARLGVERIVYHSVLHSNTPSMPHHARKARAEAMIRDGSVPWTIVQPAMYTTTPLVFMSADRHVLAPPFSIDTPFTMPSPDDLADVVAEILTRSGHEFATYELASVETLTFREMAAIMAEVLGHPVEITTVERLPFLERRAATLGRTPRQTEELAAMLDHYDKHGLRGNGNTMSHLLGRSPLSFKAAMRRQLLG